MKCNDAPSTTHIMCLFSFFSYNISPHSGSSKSRITKNCQAAVSRYESRWSKILNRGEYCVLIKQTIILFIDWICPVIIPIKFSRTPTFHSLCRRRICNIICHNKMHKTYVIIFIIIIYHHNKLHNVPCRAFAIWRLHCNRHNKIR